jgi:hypothetical protein
VKYDLETFYAHRRGGSRRASSAAATPVSGVHVAPGGDVAGRLLGLDAYGRRR